jgi:hypothetical protein
VAAGLDDTFGVAAIKAFAPGNQLAEVTLRGRVTVLKETLAGKFPSDRLMPTSWRFFPKANGVAAQMGCWATCVVPVGGGSHRRDHKHVL